MFLAFRAIFEFSATELGPGTIILRVTFGELFHGDALPITEAAFAHTLIGMHRKSQRIGKGMCGGGRTVEIGADHQSIGNIRTMIHIKLT